MERAALAAEDAEQEFGRFAHRAVVGGEVGDGRAGEGRLEGDPAGDLFPFGRGRLQQEMQRVVAALRVRHQADRAVGLRDDAGDGLGVLGDAGLGFQVDPRNAAGQRPQGGLLRVEIVREAECAGQGEEIGEISRHHQDVQLGDPLGLRRQQHAQLRRIDSAVGAQGIQFSGQVARRRRNREHVRSRAGDVGAAIGLAAVDQHQHADEYCDEQAAGQGSPTKPAQRTPRPAHSSTHRRLLPCPDEPRPM
jgi:hypothetical protein